MFKDTFQFVQKCNSTNNLHNYGEIIFIKSKVILNNDLINNFENRTLFRHFNMVNGFISLNVDWIATFVNKNVNTEEFVTKITQRIFFYNCHQ